MSHKDRERLPEELGEIAELLRNQRTEAGRLELDRIKLRVMASRRRPALISRKGNGLMRKPAFSLLLVVGLLGGGTGALAAVGGVPLDIPFEASSSDNGASNSQYCPPTSQQPGKPKKPGPARCGNPKTKIPPGQAKKFGLDGLPPGLAKKFGPGNNGNGDGNGNGHGKGHGKNKGGGDVHAFGQGNGGGNGNGHGNGKGNGGGHGNGNGGDHGNGGGHGGGKKK